MRRVETARTLPAMPAGRGDAVSMRAPQTSQTSHSFRSAASDSSVAGAIIRAGFVVSLLSLLTSILLLMRPVTLLAKGVTGLSRADRHATLGGQEEH